MPLWTSFSFNVDWHMKPLVSTTVETTLLKYHIYWCKTG